MLPGKHFTLEDLVVIAWRRKWWILIPFVVVAISTLAVSYNLPNQYQSETLIQIVPQKVPEDYVRSTVTAGIDERLQQISQQILSRTRLEKIIADFRLYPRERQRMIMEDVVEMMRKDIKIDIDRRGLGDRTTSAGFRLSFVADDPRMAQKVTTTLAEFYVNESRRDRGVLADQTNQFLESQLAEARQNLIAQEQKLEEFRRRYAGQLPTQVESNMQAVQNLQMQIQSLVESLARDRDRLLITERLHADAVAEQQSAAATMPVAPVTPGAGDTPVTATTAEQLEVARAQLRALVLKYTPDHPDVARQKRTVGELEKKLAAEELEKPLSPGDTTARPLTREEEARRNRIRDMEAEMESLGRQISFKEGEEKRLRGLVADYQGRIEATPKRESEWTSLTRDYATSEKAYQDLLFKSQNSKVAANLEVREIGEQFRVLDPASLPERPISPNRPRINALGVGGGLLLGVLLVALIEYRDSSFRTDDDVVSVLSLPVLAMIPAVTTAAERSRGRRRRLLAWFATAVVLMAGTAAAVWRLHLLEYLR